MSNIDIIILVLFAFGAYKGYLRGFIIEIFSLIAFFAGIVLALLLTMPITTRFFDKTSFYDIAAILIFILLFILLSFGIKVGGRLLKNMVDVTIFGKLDNFVGGLTGILKWAFLTSIIFWVLTSIGFKFQQNFTSKSTIFPYIIPIAPQFMSWMSGIIPFMQDLMDSMNNLPKSKDPLITLMVNKNKL
ncbi:MAG: CvpA family protein [Bacteroidota bacterium]